jgi:hypothetical protein
MPIVDPKTVRAGEKKLFSSMIESFDVSQIEKLFKETHGLLLKEKMQFKEGKTVVHNNQVAYKCDFKSVAEFSVLIDEMGKFRGFTNPNTLPFYGAEKTESYGKIIDPEIVNLRKAEFLDSLSATISNRTITELFRKRYNADTVGKMICRQGKIIVFNNHVTYQFLYEVDVIFSILIDRGGNYINNRKRNKDSTLITEKYPEEFDSQLESEIVVSQL